MPKISVIIAVYNVEPYLRRSMDCLMNQTMKDLEFICIDDCSTDGSLAILKEYAQKDSRFKIIESQQNGGAAVARNKGLEVATGEYLGFIDPDDAIDLNYYEELYKKAKEDDYDIVKCNRTTIDGGKTIVSTLNQNIIEYGLIYFSYEWTTAIYKSSIIFDNKIRFPDEIRKGQDTVFLYRIILKSKTIAIIDNVSYYYYKREDSLNANILPLRSIESALKAMSVVCKEINESNLFEADCDKYVIAYRNKLNTILRTFLYRNKSFKARLVCSEHLINNYHQCKDTNALRKIINPQWVVPYLEKKRTKLLALLFMLYKTNKEPLCYKPIEKIFSLKKIKINKRKYKVLTILGIKLKHRPRRYKIEEKLDSMKSAIQQQKKDIAEQQKQIAEQHERIIEQLDEQKKYIDKLKKQTDKKLYSAPEKNLQVRRFWKEIDLENYEENYKNLIKNLDDKSIDCVSKVLSRVTLVANSGSDSFDIWTNEEIVQLNNLKKDFRLNIIQLSESCWAYKNYLLPIKVFSPSVFYYEHEINNLENIEKLRNKCIMDVGGYIGDSALVLSKYTDKQIYSFEPVTENYNHLLKTIELNNLKNVVPVKYGLGSEECELPINLDGDASSIERKLKENLEKEVINITTLDKFVEENNIEVGLIKVDIEGFEQQFLKGAENTIKTQKPTLLLSIYHNADDFFKIKPYIESLNLGYKLKIRKPVDGKIRGEILLLAEQ